MFVFLQMAAFGGIFTGYRIAEDYESGFVRRLMLGAPRREGILLGYVFAGMLRYAFIGALIWALALVTGMRVLGSFIDIGALLLLGALVNVACTLWVAGLAFHFKSVSIGSFMQTPVFVLLFLAPVYVPLGLLARLAQAGRDGQSRDGDRRGRARVHLRRADEGDARVRLRGRAADRDGLLRGPRDAPRRARRLSLFRAGRGGTRRRRTRDPRRATGRGPVPSPRARRSAAPAAARPA